MNREDFPIINDKLIYFDNAATTLKPKCVIDKMNEYYLKHTSNIHRGDYNNSVITNNLYDEVRNIVSKFVNCDSDEVIYTSGTTMSINMIVFGYMRKHLSKGDEVILNRSEHASNILPWFKLREEIGIKIKYAKLDENYSLDLDSIKDVVTKKTKVISLAHITNVIGDVRDVKSIGEFCKKNNIIFCVDGAQSVPHMKVDFKNSNIDFLSFSAHKMCGPTGVGVLVGRKELLDDMDPIMLGGGMNDSFEDDSYVLKESPIKFEAGTPAIAEVIGMGEAIKYLDNIGMNNIHKYEVELKKYLVNELKKIDNIIVYNDNTDSGIISFNIDKIFVQDLSIYLDKYNICVRAGNHCTKLLKNELGVKNTVRVSLYFYNTKEEIDKLIEALNNIDNIYNVIL